MIKIKDKQQTKSIGSPQSLPKEQPSTVLCLPENAYSRLMKTNSDINEFLEMENMAKEVVQKHKFEEASQEKDASSKKNPGKTGTKSVSHFKPAYSASTNIFNYSRIKMPQYRASNQKQSGQSNGGSLTKTANDDTRSESKQILANSKPELGGQTNLFKQAPNDKKESRKKFAREENVLFYSELLNQNRFSRKYLYPKELKSRGNTKEPKKGSSSVKRFGAVTPKTKFSPESKVIESRNQIEEDQKSSISNLKGDGNSGRRMKGGWSVSREPIFQVPQMARSQSIDKRDSARTSQLPTERIFGYQADDTSEPQKSNKPVLIDKIKKIFTDQIELVNLEIFTLQQSLNDLRDSLLLPLNRQMREAVQTLESNQQEMQLHIYKFEVQASKVEKIKQDLKVIFSPDSLSIERYHIDPRQSEPLQIQENLKLLSPVERGNWDHPKKDSLANVMRSIRDRKAEQNLKRFNPKPSNKVKIGSVDISKESVPSLENTSLTIQTPDVHDDTAKFTSFLNSELEKIKRRFLVDDHPNPVSDWKKPGTREAVLEPVPSRSISKGKRGGTQTAKSVYKPLKRTHQNRWTDTGKVMVNTQYRSVEKNDKLRGLKVDSQSETGEVGSYPDKKSLLISRLSQGKIKLKVSPLFQ